MIKKILKFFLILLMILGIAFSISNFLPKTANAVMTDELLDFIEVGDGYLYRCERPGNGCHTVIEEV